MTWPAIFCQPPRPQAALVPGLQEVVDEAHEAHARHEEDHEYAHEGHVGLPHEMAHDIADSRTEDEDDATHGGRSPLGVVRLRTVITDELAPLEAFEQLDEERR